MAAVFALPVASCSGNILEAPDSPDLPVEPAALPRSPDPPRAPTCNAAGAAPLRGLTRRQYDNTVRDLLGDTRALAAGDFIPDDRPGTFESNAESPVTALGATKYRDAAEALAQTAVTTRLGSLVPCVPASGGDACAREFIRTFGRRAYRRPLSDGEAQRLFTLYAGVRQRADFAGGIRVVLQAMLQSPSFTHHVERGTPVPGAAIVPLTPHELASRLSYFLWNTLPDGPLFAAAEAGKLASPAGIEAEALRMLDDPRARSAVMDFFQQWLDLDRLDGLDKSKSRFPDWTPALAGQMRRETETFFAEVFWNGDAKLTTLLTAPFSYLDASLAGKIYGLTGATGDAPVKTALDPTRQAGFLTQPSLLAMNAKRDQTDPVHRGLFVRKRLLCRPTPSPPDDVDVRAPDPDPSLTTRERYTVHLQNEACRGCHRLMNPIGFAFESYDAIGRFRATESGKPIDASGEIAGSADLDGPFTGVVELAAKLSRSPEVRECITTEWLSYALGAPALDLSCAVGELAAEFSATGTDLRRLVVAIARSPAFRQRRAVPPEGCR